MKIDFRRLDGCPDDTLANMLVESYAPLLREPPEDTAVDLRRGWREFDRDVHRAPDTIGRRGFMTFVGDQLVGFGSWDPRGGPEVARVGHNCVRPAYQQRGYGRRQIEAIIERLRAQGFVSAEARTGEHAFFEPARRMYLRCGFRLARREPGVLGPAYGTVVYQTSLKGMPPDTQGENLRRSPWLLTTCSLQPREFARLRKRATA